MRFGLSPTFNEKPHEVKYLGVLTGTYQIPIILLFENRGLPKATNCTVQCTVHNRVRVVVDYVDVNCELGKINENNNFLRNRLSLFFLNEAFRENNSNVCLLSHR